MSRYVYPPAALALLLGLIAGCDERVEQPLPSENWQRIDASGNILSPDDPGPHRCVLDPAVGLMWQVHDDNGLHDRDNRYTWYSTDRQRHMSEPGLADGGECRRSSCDTQSLVAAVNEQSLCGFTDWRLPSREELMSLGEAERRETGLIVDPAYFPGANAGEYWTGETFRLYPQSAWAVDFGNGLDRADLKSEAKAVRLVRNHAQATETN
ncbi:MULTISPECIES: DUF1566 domain-containing protein [unclassified Wenzhouxiangella]|uniref:Lcl C-terminal domain-containing protein n=1 Tax=unclassified Wenzhouxiangella TaxID=2613841 RepID=UPI000E329798|nr:MULTISPECIES: DUF1566 domain-containing protein [unclassified Wenzhouxiangella]RFF27367.1 DUF1566 domain-containing protein [Wenzhouxiangella sp. 15181]RFP68795.1 DUF1566 domain-containing protein [Wenzhouxiangella sp. 15190]